MKSYIKIYGPPVLKSIRVLEKLAVKMPEICIMDSVLIRDLPKNLASIQNHAN